MPKNHWSMFDLLRWHYRNQHGSCCYCGRQCLLIMDPQARSDANNSPSYPHLATVEHIYQRTDIRRMLLDISGKKNGIKSTKMACKKCNNDRGSNKGECDLKRMRFDERNEVHGLILDILNGNYNGKIII
jgi:hypothetical protein